jgi:protease-4
MRFLRGLWHFLVGLKDALALILLLLIFVVIWGATRGTSPATVPSGAALVLDLDGVIVDQATDRSPLAVIGGSQEVVPEIEARQVIEAIERARRDSNVKAISLEMDGFLGAGAANLQSIGDALQRFRASGKPVRAYATAYLDDSYYLAAHANQVWVNPLGGVLLTGPGGSGLYLKGALDRLGVNINVFRAGTYKAAVEPFTRTEPSPEAREADQALVDTVWTNYVTDVEAARPRVRINATLANLPARLQATGGDLAAQSLRDGFVDTIGTQVGYGRDLAKVVGKGSEARPGSYNAVRFRDYLRATSPWRATSGDAVGVVYVAGTIVDGEAPRGSAGGDSIAKVIEDATRRSELKALVVRIDSPGGSVTASEKIRAAIAEAKLERKIPVVASFGDVAASGGYWIATAADAIVAEPSTITGSIGVFAILPSFEGTLAKLGINAAGVKSTPFSGSPDVLQGLTPETRTVLQLSVEDMYRRFLGLVSQARRMPTARVDQVAQGRVWAGGTARQLGLVDRLGGLDEAVAEAARRAKLDADKVRVVNVEVAPSLSSQFVGQFFGARAQVQRDAFAQVAGRGELRLASAVADVLTVAQGTTMQARCLSCAAYAPRVAALPRADSLVSAAAGALAR